MQLASRFTLSLDLYDERHQEELDRIPSQHLMKLLRLRRSRRDKLKSLLDGDMFLAGNSNSVCRGCDSERDDRSWLDLKTRVFMEMDKSPSGDALCTLDFQQWPEVIECLDAKCGCGQSWYDNLHTLQIIKKCVDSLPLCI